MPGEPRLAVLCCLLLTMPMSAAGDDSWLTRSGYYRISFTSELEPIPINRIHSWIVHVTDADGVPLDDASIAVTGGMPAHDHGLPTAPKATRPLGSGDYLLEGVRFHMNGEWELLVTIEAAGRRDTVVITLTI